MLLTSFLNKMFSITMDGTRPFRVRKPPFSIMTCTSKIPVVYQQSLVTSSPTLQPAGHNLDLAELSSAICLFKDPISLQVGSTEAGMFASTATVTGNVILDGNDIDPNTPRGFGIDLLPDTGLVTVQNNIIAHDISSRPYGLAISSIQAPIMTSLRTTSSINGPGNGAINNNGTGNTISPNAIDQSGYLDPNRDVASYMASLGGTATLAAFLAAAENQSTSNWNPQYTADAVNSYIPSRF